MGESVNRQSRRARFRDIFEHYAELINSGQLEAGDRLPPHTELAEQHEISHATAAKAVNALRNALYVRTDTQGTYVHLAVHRRLLQLLCDTLNDLEGLGQQPHLGFTGGVPHILARSGAVCWNEAEQKWEVATS